MSALTVRQVRLRYLVLHGLRWFPAGLLMPVMILLMRERGLSLTEIGVAAAAQGVMVLLLELPTGGLSDALGRRPVLLAAAVLNLAALSLFALAHTVALFVVVFLLQGVYRALDSGPLESWYVDATLATDPAADIERGLSRGGAVLGLSISAGALLSGGLVALGPLGPVRALTLPILVAIAVQLVALVALTVLLVEARPAGERPGLRASVAATPRMVGDAVGLLRRSRVLLALVAVELFWGFGSVTFEGLLPVRLSELVGSADRAGALLGPANSAAWLASAAGAALIPLVSRRLGAAPTAALLHVVQGGTVVAMALLAGPAGVLTAYLACYAVHGAANPLYAGLLHRQVDGPYRNSVISLASMASLPAGALGGVLLTALADAVSVPTAMVLGAAVMAVAAPLYLPAWRAARRPAAVGDGAEGGAVGGGAEGDAVGSGELAASPVEDASDRRPAPA